MAKVFMLNEENKRTTKHPRSFDAEVTLINNIKHNKFPRRHKA